MSRSIFVILKFKHAYLKISVSGRSKQASIHKCVHNEVCQAHPNQNKVGSEVTHYRPTKFKLRPSCSFKHTRPYLVWVNLLNEDVLWFEVSVDDSLAVQEANSLVCREKGTTLASLVEAQHTSEMSMQTFQNSQLSRSQYTTHAIVNCFVVCYSKLFYAVTDLLTS